MLPRNPLLQLTAPRLYPALARLEKLVWRTARRLPVEAGQARFEHVPLAVARGDVLRPLEAPEPWGRLYEQRWHRVELPPAPGADRWLRWQEQGEATLYLDGEPFFGFDIAHRRVRLPEHVREGWIESLCVQMGIFHPEAHGLSPQGSQLEGAFYDRRDELAWDCWHDFAILVEALEVEWRATRADQPRAGFGFRPPIDTATPLLRTLLRRLEDALDAWETAGLAAFHTRLRAAYAELRQTAAPAVAAVLTGHAHIDLVWLWPENVGEAKAVHTFATVDHLLGEYPELRFAYSQPASYRAVERREPGLMGRVRQRLAEGRWEATGAMWVESDTAMACGEALARSFLLGQKHFRELRGGTPARVVWLPDVFGYAGCLPQLMVQCGADSFFTTKLGWSAVTRFPYSSFVWRGQDGSEVVAHLSFGGKGYNNWVAPAHLRECEQLHRQSDVHPEFLHPTGWGDGGGGPTAEMCERARRLESLAGMPLVRWGGVEDFFARLHARRPELPTFQGEIYLEYHRGTYTTHGDVKEAFRGAERALQALDAAHGVRGLGPVPERLWQRAVFAQFHDYIPGSSVPIVYDQGLPELRALAAEALSLAGAALHRDGGEPSLFNPSPLPRLEPVAGGLLALPPLSGRPLRDAAAAPAASVDRAARTLRSDRLEAVCDAAGRLAALAVDGVPVRLSGPAAELVIYPDVPGDHAAWDIDRAGLAHPQPAPAAAELVDAGAEGGTAWLAFARDLGGGAGTARVTYRAEAGSPALRIDLDLDWQGRDRLLKVEFPTRCAGPFARFGSPFGSIARPAQAGFATAEAQWEVPGNRWAAVTDEGERDGLWVATEAKYGWTARDGRLGLSLVRSVHGPGQGHEYTKAWPPTLAPSTPRAAQTDLGRHRLRLAVGRYDAHAPVAELPAALADTLFTPALPYRGQAVDGPLGELADDSSLVPHWLKPADEGADLILRLHEVQGRAGTAALELRPGWTATRTDLSEGAGTPCDPAALPYRPYEIVSLRLRFHKS